MAFKEVKELNAEVTTALGGKNKTTGKNNPSRIEGYFLGTKIVASKRSPDGTAKLHIFQTEKGNVGVWGKTDLNRKLAAVAVGSMVRASFDGMKTAQRGEMYTYKVEVDSENIIDVSGYATSATSETDSGGVEEAVIEDGGSDLSSLLDDTKGDSLSFDEPPVPKAAKPATPAVVPNASRQAQIQALLNRNKTGSRA